MQCVNRRPADASRRRCYDSEKVLRAAGCLYVTRLVKTEIPTSININGIVENADFEAAERMDLPGSTWRPCTSAPDNHPCPVTSHSPGPARCFKCRNCPIVVWTFDSSLSDDPDAFSATHQSGFFLAVHWKGFICEV
jgi:hypothetical protein